MLIHLQNTVRDTHYRMAEKTAARYVGPIPYSCPCSSIGVTYTRNIVFWNTRRMEATMETVTKAKTIWAMTMPLARMEAKMLARMEAKTLAKMQAKMLAKTLAKMQARMLAKREEGRQVDQLPPIFCHHFAE